MAQPWFKFFPQTWTGDPALSLCSIAARGYWIECLCIMHAAKERGKMQTPTGQNIDLKGRARMIRVEESEARTLEKELISGGVADLEGGVLISRRMVKDTERSLKAVEAGKIGAMNKRKKQRGEDPDVEKVIQTFNLSKARMKALSEWLEHYKDIGRSHSVNAMRNFLTQWKDKTDDEFIEIVRFSLAGNFKNLREPDSKTPGEADTVPDYPDCPQGLVPYEFGGDYIRPGNKTDQRIYRQKNGLD